MNSHLSEAQIAGWLVGERARDVVRHASECITCRSEIQRTELALTGFRRSVHAWSTAERPANLPLARPSRVRLYRTAALSWVAATAIVLFLFVARRHVLPLPPSSAAGSSVQVTGTDAAISDEALLQRVSQALSQSIPRPMQPLSPIRVSASTSALTGSAQ